MKLFFKKFTLALMILPLISIITNNCIGRGQTAYAAEPTVRLQKTFTSDTRIKETKRFGNGIFYYGEDGRVYFGYERINFMQNSWDSYPSTPTEVVLGVGEEIAEIREEEDKIRITTNYGNVYEDAYGKFIKVFDNSGVIDIIEVGESKWFITEDGVYGVGDNTSGRLGVGSDASYVYVQTKVEGIDGRVKSIYTSGNSTWFITEDGVYAAGNSADGKLGVGAGRYNAATKVKEVGADIEFIHVDGNSTWFITGSGLYAAGLNGEGQLGVGDTSSCVYETKKVQGIEGRVKSIENRSEANGSGYHRYYTWFITEKGVYGTGYNEYGRLGVGSTDTEVYEAMKVNNVGADIESIYINGSCTWFITGSGVYAAGYNYNGQLGIGNNSSCVYDATEVKEIGIADIEYVYSYGGSTWFIAEKKIAVGYYSDGRPVLERQKKIYATGFNAYGQLGIGHANNVTKPEIVNGIDVDVKFIITMSTSASYGSGMSTWFVTEDKVYATGNNYNGNLGVEEVGYYYISSPQQVLNVSNVEKISIIDYKTYFYCKDGLIYISHKSTSGIPILQSNQETNTGTETSTDTEYDEKLFINESKNYYLYTKNGELYYEKTGYSGSPFKLEVPYVNKMGSSVAITYRGDRYTYVDTIDGLYSISFDSNNYNAGVGKVKTNIELKQVNEATWISKTGEVYSADVSGDTSSKFTYMTGKIGEGIDYYKDGLYYGFDGTVYVLDSREVIYVVDGTGYGRGERKLVKLGIQPWPRKEGVIIDNLNTSAIARYAFSTSNTYEGVTANEWKSYDKNSGQILLNPSASGVYYIHFEIAQDNTVYKYVFGPYTVQLNGGTVVSTENNYAYMTADMRIPDEMTAAFNVVFTPPQDIFLTGELDEERKRMFIGIIEDGLIDITVRDSTGKDVSDKLDPGYVTAIYKNGVYEGNEYTNYLFKKRDDGAVSDNVYILKLNVGGTFTGVGKEYLVEFNGMKGYDSITMQNLIPIKTQKFGLHVYVTELPNVT